MARIEEQQKAIFNLKSNLMDDLNDKGVLSDPECQKVIEIHQMVVWFVIASIVAVLETRYNEMLVIALKRRSVYDSQNLRHRSVHTG